MRKAAATVGAREGRPVRGIARGAAERLAGWVEMTHVRARTIPPTEATAGDILVRRVGHRRRPWWLRPSSPMGGRTTLLWARSLCLFTRETIASGFSATLRPARANPRPCPPLSFWHGDERPEVPPMTLRARACPPQLERCRPDFLCCCFCGAEPQACRTYQLHLSDTCSNAADGLHRNCAFSTILADPFRLLAQTSESQKPRVRCIPR